MRVRRGWTVAALALAALLFMPAQSALGQEGDPTSTTVAATDVDDPQATVNAVTAALVGVAGVTAVLTVAFWWHTKPGRRAAAHGSRVLDADGSDVGD